MIVGGGGREGEREEGRRVIVGEGERRGNVYTKAQTRCVVFGEAVLTAVF